MDEEKFKALMSDECFIKELVKQDTDEQVKKLFACHGVVLTPQHIDFLAEAIAFYIYKSHSQRSPVKFCDDDLDLVSGGKVNSTFLKDASTILGAVAGHTIGLALGYAIGYGLCGTHRAGTIGAAISAAPFSGGGGAFGMYIGKRLAAKYGT